MTNDGLEPSNLVAHVEEAPNRGYQGSEAKVLIRELKVTGTGVKIRKHGDLYLLLECKAN